MLYMPNKNTIYFQTAQFIDRYIFIKKEQKPSKGCLDYVFWHIKFVLLKKRCNFTLDLL